MDGVAAGVWRLPAIPGQWLESTFYVPAHLISSSATVFTLVLTSEVADAQLSPFYFWAYQGEVATSTPAPVSSVGARFGDVAQLVGHDLSETAPAAGDMLHLVLYWQALNPPRAEWHVFVHLVDPENDTVEGIVAQWDAAPRAGTYPFWVWDRQQVVVELVSLALPGDLASGDYALLVGLYHLGTGMRAPLDGGSDSGADRLLLSTITVR